MPLDRMSNSGYTMSSCCLLYTSISNPKPNGYRSLHLTIRLPVFFAEKEVHVPVEIQLRTDVYKRQRMTHEQIAQHISSAREAVARMLKSFSEDGLVELRRGAITLRDKNSLNHLK